MADSRQTESKAGVAAVSPLTTQGGQSTTRSTTHLALKSKAQHNGRAAAPTTHCFFED